MFPTLIRCYLFGLSCTFGVGPIFLLTFRAVMFFGFWYGIIIALGSSLADSLLFFLGVKGLLSLLRDSKIFLALFDICGGIALITIGLCSFNKTYELPSETGTLEANGLGLFWKSFLLTLLSPFSIALFAFWGMKIFPQTTYTPFIDVLINSLALGAGTFTGLVIVTVVIRLVGSTFSKKYFNVFSKLTALGFIGVGIYFVFDFVKTCFR